MKKLIIILFFLVVLPFTAWVNKSFAACLTIGDSCSSSASCNPQGATECGIVSCISGKCAIPGSTAPALKLSVNPSSSIDRSKLTTYYIRLENTSPNQTYVFQILNIDDKVIASYSITTDVNGGCSPSSAPGSKNSGIWWGINCSGGFIDAGINMGKLPDSELRSDGNTSFTVKIKDTDVTTGMNVKKPASPPASSPSPSPVSCEVNVDQDKQGYGKTCHTNDAAPQCGTTTYCDGSTHKTPQKLTCFDQTPGDADSSGTCVFKDNAQLPVLSAPSVTFPNQPFTVSVSSCKSATAKFSCSDIAANSGDIGPTTSTSSCGEPPEANTANGNASTKINFTKKGYALIKVDCGGVQTSTTVTLSEALFTPTPTPPLPPCKVDIYSTDGKGCTSIFSAIGPLNTDSFKFIGQLFAVLLSISGGIALLLIIRSGYQLMTSQGNPEKVKEARERLTSVFVGLLFLVLSIVILEVIGVDLLNLPGLSK